MPAHLALEEQFDPYSFVKYVKVIGRAYQRQAIELVTICRIFVEVSPEEDQHDAKFKEAMLATDMALRYATDAGKKTTDTASSAFDEALKKLLLYEKNAHLGSSATANIVARMTQAKETDQRSLGLFNRLKAKRGVHTLNDSPTLPIDFVLLKSLTDPKPLVVHQILSTQPATMSSEILWNFSRYTDDRRIALRQNPHFYLDLPTFGRAYGTEFSKDSMRDSDFILKRNDTVYILVDKPDLGRVYLEVEAKRQKRIFGNVWMPNGVMIFKDIRGKLESEQLVGNDIHVQSHQELFWRNEPDIPDISLKRSSAIPRELPTLPEAWRPVTDIRDWKELIQKKTLPSTRISVKVCVSHANRPVVTNDEAPRSPDTQAADASSKRSNVPLPRGADAQYLPQTQVPPTPLAPVPPNRHTPDPQSIAATVPSSRVPVSSSSSPPPAQVRGSLVTATPSTMTPSSLPLPAHHGKPPATQEPQKDVPSPHVPAPPSPFPGTNRTKVDKPTQDGKGPTKSTKASFSISSFNIFKPPSMPGAFPGPQMDDWVVVSPGPSDAQGGNWVKRLFRRDA